MSELKDTQKIKVVTIYEQTPQIFGTLPKPKNSPLGHKKVKKTPKLSQNQMSTYLNPNLISTKLRLNIMSTSFQPQPQYQLNLNLNLNSIWL